MDGESTHVAPQSKPLALSWLQLIRLPNVFTAIADVCMGYLVAGGAIPGDRRIFLIVAATCCLYWAGMIWNDLFDLELDRIERPERPLPSGRIAVAHARIVGVLLLLSGLAAATALQVLTPSTSPILLRPGALAFALASAVMLYDGVLKTTVMGPWMMGACRSFNILMGMSVVAEGPYWRVPAPWLAAIGIGIYVAGITWFARDEAVFSSRKGLIHGAFWMLFGVGLLAVFPEAGLEGDQKAVLKESWFWPVLLLLMTLPVWRRAAKAIVSRSPQHVQGTIRQSLLTLPLLDASLVLLMAGPGPAVAILSLLAPSLILSRWIRMT